MDTCRVLRERKSTTEVTSSAERPSRTDDGHVSLDCRLTEVTLSSQTNPLPFRLHIWPNRSCTDELENGSNRYYHVEEILLDETDLGKEIELIPVAHYTKVRRRHRSRVQCNSTFLLCRKTLFRSTFRNAFHSYSK